MRLKMKKLKNKLKKKLKLNLNLKWRSSSRAPPPPPLPSPPSDPSTSRQEELGPVLLEPMSNFASLYNIGCNVVDDLGCFVFDCTPKSTVDRYICKAVRKTKITKPRLMPESLSREVLIHRRLSGMQNIVRFVQAYEEKAYLFLVMESCTGRALSEEMELKGTYSEGEAARACMDMVRAVQSCHSNGVLHRNVTPWKFLRVDNSENAELKLMDFGPSILNSQDVKKRLDQKVRVEFMAPEALKGEFEEKSDIWGVGVILYRLLSGEYPFMGDTERKIQRRIKKCEVDMQREPWPSISFPAKDLVLLMLTKDLSQRASATTILEHDWIKSKGESLDGISIDMDYLFRVGQFLGMNNLKKTAILMLTENLPAEAIRRYKQDFRNEGSHARGVTVQEMIYGLDFLNLHLDDDEVRRLIDPVDGGTHGSLHYKECLAAMIPVKDIDSNIHRVFRYFDNEYTGFITRERLGSLMAQYGQGHPQDINSILYDYDLDRDMRLSRDEFMTVMRLPDHL